MRAQDIPEFVADGAADAGVTGWDLVCESGRSLEALLDLEFGRCRLVLAAHEEARGARPEKVAKARGKYLRAPLMLAVAYAWPRWARRAPWSSRT